MDWSVVYCSASWRNVELRSVVPVGGVLRDIRPV